MQFVHKSSLNPLHVCLVNSLDKLFVLLTNSKTVVLSRDA